MSRIGRSAFTEKPEPEPEVCEFCGAVRRWARHEVPALGWVTYIRPGPCSCPGAAAHRAELERKMRAQEAQERQRVLLERSGLPRRYWRCTFEATVETPENQQALARVREFARSFSGKGVGLFITGPVGTGKTHLAACVVNELARRGIRTIFGNVLDLLGRLRRSYSEEAQEEEWRIMQELTGVPLLVVDDLGKEKVSEWVEQTLYRIVDMRYRDERTLLVTSNFTLSELEKRYPEVGPALVSRLAEMCEGVRLAGRDWRREA